MTSRAPFQTQLSSIMEVLLKAAVAEIAKLVDDKCALLHLEISQKQSENEMLKRKVVSMESEHSQLQLRFESHVNRGTKATEDKCTNPTGNEKFPEDEDAPPLPFTIKEEDPEEASLWIRDSAAHVGLATPKSPEFSNFYNSGQRTVEVGGLQFTVKTEKDGDRLSILEDKCHHRVGKQSQHETDFSFNERESQLWSSIIEESDMEAAFPDFNSVVEEYSNTFSTPPDGDSNSYKPSNVPHNGCSGEYDKDAAHSSSFQAKAQPDKLKEQTYAQRNPLHVAHTRQSADCERPVAAADGAAVAHPHHRLHQQNPPKPPPGTTRGSYVCPDCGKPFSCLQELKLHEQCHYRKRAFWCSVCGKSFQCSSHLSIHHRTHTGERPYGCTQCGKRFTQQSSLRVHQRTHSGERPYSCAQCGKTFILMHHLKRHRVIHSYS